MKEEEIDCEPCEGRGFVEESWNNGKARDCDYCDGFGFWLKSTREN